MISIEHIKQQPHKMSVHYDPDKSTDTNKKTVKKAIKNLKKKSKKKKKQ